MIFAITWDGWDKLNVRGRTWLQKKTSDGLILLKLVSENGLGIDREVSLDADAVRECDIWHGMIECNKYYRG
jgi:hypothetical protein